MKKYVVIMFLLLTGCLKDSSSNFLDQSYPDPTDADIANVLTDENAYRLALGQTELSRGLSCSVQPVSSGQWLSSSSPGYNAGQGVIVTSGTSYSFLLKTEINQSDSPSNQVNSVLPVAIQPMFVNINYKISCSGQLVILQTGYQALNLSSDDGSILTIDGSQVINNDGNHGMTAKAGTKLLRRGVHTVTLVYAQTGSGNFGLILDLNGGVLDPRLLAH